MKKGRYFLILLLCIAFVGLAFMLVVTEKTDEQIQDELIAQAEELLADKIYIRAEALLDEAAACSDARRLEAEQLLKEVYRALIEESGYSMKLEKLYESQLGRDGIPTDIYLEIADYYFQRHDRKKGIEALRVGYTRTGDEQLGKHYEQERYTFTFGGDTFEAVTEVYNSHIQVKQLGAWGLADYLGELVIPCEYDKITTFSAGQAVVKRENEIFTIDGANHRVYLLKTPVEDFGNYGNALLSFKTEGGWVRGNGEMNMGTMAFEALGMYNNGYAAAKLNGKWGVIDTEAEWVIEPVYDEIIMDSIGRCWEQNAVFVRSSGKVYLIVNGERLETAYEDAWPFYEEGWAAVKLNGKWGFIDTAGQVMIDYQYQEARSFSGHLAAVRMDQFWGFISRRNQLVIEDLYYDVRNFVDGAAAIENMDGWQFLILDEYRED